MATSSIHYINTKFCYLLCEISFSQRCWDLFLFWILQLFLPLYFFMDSGLDRTVGVNSTNCRWCSVSAVFSTYDPYPQDMSVWNGDHQWLIRHANAAAVPYVISVKYTISTISGLMLPNWWLNNIKDEQGFSFFLINMPSSLLMAFFCLPSLQV